MNDNADPWREAIRREVNAAAERVIAHLDQRVDASMTEVRGRLGQVEGTQRILAQQNQITTAILAALTDEQQHLPGPAAIPPADVPPRPRELDQACTADPSQGLQRLRVVVQGREMTCQVEPGSDPDELWRALHEDVAWAAARREVSNAGHGPA